MSSAPIPTNQAEFSLTELVSTTGAVVRQGSVPRVAGVSTDTRQALTGQLFVALRGDRFDGHDYLKQAVVAGATALLVEPGVQLPAAVCALEVSSTLEALGALARHHRRRWGRRVFAVAGSAGKTTTKETLAAALHAVHPGGVWATPGNLNNRVGVPLVLLALQPQHQVAVLELGTNVSGEVEILTAISEPNVGIVTLIDVEHAEGLGSLDDIEREEGALFRGLREDGLAVFNVDDARVKRQAQAARAARRLGYGRSQDASFRLLDRRILEGGTVLRVARPDRSEVELTTPLLGEPAAFAALAALASIEGALERKLAGAEVSRALGAVARPLSGRLDLVRLADGSVVIDDSYNANPASVLSSLSTAQEVAEAAGARLLLVVGEMRELGPYSQLEHQRLAAKFATSGATLLLAVAGDARFFLETERSATMQAAFCKNVQEALDQLLQHIRPGDVVLVKASRSVGAERVVQGLIERKGRAA